MAGAEPIDMITSSHDAENATSDLLESRALQRWENEGGRCDQGHPALVERRERSALRKNSSDAHPATASDHVA